MRTTANLSPPGPGFAAAEQGGATVGEAPPRASHLANFFANKKRDYTQLHYSGVVMYCRTLQTVAPHGAFDTTSCTRVRIACAEVTHG